MPGAADTIGLLHTLLRARLIAPMRPDRYLRMGAAMRREGTTPTVGFAAAAQRCPDRPGLIDERGIRIVADGFVGTNEIRFDADEEWLYVVESNARRISRASSVVSHSPKTLANPRE